MADQAKWKRFGSYISTLRQKKGLRQEQVCEGLCTKQQLSCYEKGVRTAAWLLQGALLERLGVGAEDYEQYLGYIDYDHWEARQRILCDITYGETRQAAQSLKEYRAAYVEHPRGRKTVSDRLERQFCLTMQAQIRRQEGAGREELYRILEEAVKLTVPLPREKSLEGRVLSLKELNLLLEMEQYREGGGREGHYRAVLAYMENMGLDGIGRAKLYPKAVYFLCRCLMGEDADGQGSSVSAMGEDADGQDCGVPVTTSIVRNHCTHEYGKLAQLLTYCSLAVECLRDNSRMYYLWELLDMRERLLGRMAESLRAEGERRKAEALEPIRRENAEWKGALESAYAEFQVSKEMVSCTYLYVEKGVSCINDVIRIRRKMLGISREELCRGFCDVRTLMRLENRKTVPREEIVEELFERLGLPRELTRTELVTDEPEARELMARLRKCVNNRQAEEAAKLTARIRELVPMDIRCNQQTLLNIDINLRRGRGELDAEAYCTAMGSVLELTMPFEAFLTEGEKYLTYMEQTCIQNMMQGMDKDSEEFLLCLKYFEEMYRPYEENKLLGTVNHIYELIMGYVESERGNQGQFDKSDWYNEKIVETDLRFRRFGDIAHALYGRWWNDAERKRRGVRADRILDSVTELSRCVIFSQLNKRKKYTDFYRKKLSQEKDKKG